MKRASSSFFEYVMNASFADGDRLLETLLLGADLVEVTRPVVAMVGDLDAQRLDAGADRGHLRLGLRQVDFEVLVGRIDRVRGLGERLGVRAPSGGAPRRSAGRGRGP